MSPPVDRLIGRQRPLPPVSEVSGQRRVNVVVGRYVLP
ncbi:hypothetical protein ATKI12_8376 [Kitasatospora sp. Ki12]